MKLTKKLFALLLVLALTVSLLPSAVAAGKSVTSLKDVSASAYYYDSVAYLFTNRYMNGTGADTFSPDAALTRGMVVTVLYNMAGKPETEYKDIFSDVPDGKYYSRAVVWAAANGIAKGSDGAFAPDQNVTREQLASFLYPFAALQKMDTSAKADLSKYKDSGAVSSYARDALAWCVHGLDEKEVTAAPAGADGLVRLPNRSQRLRRKHLHACPAKGRRERAPRRLVCAPGRGELMRRLKRSHGRRRCAVVLSGHGHGSASVRFRRRAEHDLQASHGSSKIVLCLDHAVASLSCMPGTSADEGSWVSRLAFSGSAGNRSPSRKTVCSMPSNWA